MERPIYLDNNSTTPLDPAVLEAMLPFLTLHFGNPSNRWHWYGSKASDAVERARGQVAALIGANEKDIVFTSGATESNNLALLGMAHRNRLQGAHLITVKTEHKAVLEPCRHLERKGFRVSYLAVDRFGQVTADAVRKAITPQTLLVSVMAANNEVGTLQPVEAIGAVCKEKEVIFHCDAAQAIGKISVDVNAWGVDLLTISAHKVYGPKGVGALYTRGGNPDRLLESLFYGGGQERGVRSGTLPVANIVGLGSACELAHRQLAADAERLHSLRNRLKTRLFAAFPDLVVHGHPSAHLPGLLNVGFPETDGDALFFSLHGMAVSQGSSCSAESIEPSHVLRALGVSDSLARASIRMGIGRFTSADEIDRAAQILVDAVNRLRQPGKKESDSECASQK